MKKTIKTLSLAITVYCLLLTVNCMAQTTTLCNFDFNGSSSLPVSAASTASNITASVNGTEADAGYGGTATGSGAFTQNATAGDALSMANSSGNNTNYWTLTLGGSALNNYMAYHIYFQGEHSTTGATAITVSWSTDGSTYTALSQTISPGLNNTFTEAFVDLSSINALNGASAVYVRFAASGASGTGTLRMDNLEIQAATSPWTVSGGNVTFTGGVTAASLSTTGALTGGATTVSSLTNTGNLNVTGTSNLGTVSSGATTVSSLNVSSLIGTGNRQVLVGAGGGLYPSPFAAGDPWILGGNTGASPNTLGTNDGTDLSIIAGGNGTTGIERMRVAANGRIGIGGFTSPNLPNALLHVNTLNFGTTPGLIVDDNNTNEISPEFQINSDGSTAIYGNQPGTHDILSINAQFAPDAHGNNFISNMFRVTYDAAHSRTAVGIGNSNYPFQEAPATTVSTYKMLTVNGDVSLANYYPGGGGGNPADGFTAVEVLGNDQVPTRRGIAVDADPDGDMNFFINSAQGGTGSPPDNIAEFHFKVGDDASYHNYANGTAAPNLMTINQNGEVIIPKLPNPALATGSYNNVLVDKNGKLVYGATVGSTSSAAWVLGGNNQSGSPIFGNQDATSDLPIWVGNSEKMRIDAAGNVLINTATTTAPNYKKTLTVNGDVCFANYGSSGNIHANDGVSGFEILGMNGIPSGRGISVEEDPNGDFNFYINGEQGYPAGTVAPSEFNFKMKAGSVITNLMTLNAAGGLVLGQKDNDVSLPGYNTGLLSYTALLQVKGDAIVKGNLFVTTTGWSDFVFDKNYKLMPLNEVESFYKANHHLPSVPTTKEIEEKGNNLGQTDAVLLQKIEELTLYLVEQKKIAEKQQKEIDELKAIIKQK